MNEQLIDSLLKTHAWNLTIILNMIIYLILVNYQIITLSKKITMKTFIKNIIKYTFIAIAIFAGTTFADAAGRFDTSDPFIPYGFLSVHPDPAEQQGDCTGCSNHSNAININAPEYEDVDQFSAYIYFRNEAQDSPSNTITNARARLSISGSTLMGRLTGGNVVNPVVTDTASLNNLPEDYEIRFVSARAENVHGDTQNEALCAGYDFNYSVSGDNLFSLNGVSIGSLDTFGEDTSNGSTGWCSQGYVVITLEVENTTESEEPVQNIVQIQTRDTDEYDQDSASILGRLLQGNDVDVYFRWHDSTNFSCQSGGTQTQIINNVDAGSNGYDLFANLNNLEPDTTYYYRACAEDNGTFLDNGGIKQFTTDTVGVDEPEPNTAEVVTENAINSEHDENSGVIRGELVEGTNVDVYFKWDDSTNFDCQSGGTRINVENNVSAGNNGYDFSTNLINLESNTTYYYRACAEDNNTFLDQGQRKQFTTDSADIGGGNDLAVETISNPNVTTTSATIEGRILSGSTNYSYFVWSSNNNLVCGSTQNSGSTALPLNWEALRTTGDIFDYTFPTGTLTPGIQYFYRACASANGVIAQGIERSFETDSGLPTGSDADVNTLDPDENGDNNTLNGEIRNVNASEDFTLFFSFSSSSNNVSCINPSLQFEVQNSVSSDRFFEYEFNTEDEGFSDGTYYYRACADNEDNNSILSGVRKEITIDTDNGGGSNGNEEPNAETRNPDNVDENSAELNGRIEMNDFNNGIVFYVYGQDESQIEDVDVDYNEYSDINEDGDDLQKEVVDNDNDSDSWENYPENVSGLDEDERYYYRICVEFRDSNNDKELECGNVEDFETDRDNNNDDDDDDDDVEIQTQSARNINRTSAQMCGEIINDGGSAVQSFIEFRRASGGNFSQTPVRQRNEVVFCENVSGLTPNTQYRFRACTPQGCGVERSFTTIGTIVPTGVAPIIFTETPTNIRFNSATLNSRYVANAPSASCRFDFGRTQALGRQTRTYNVNGIGQCPHNFTALSANTQYCVQAVITTQFGTDRGNVTCFNTPFAPTTGGPRPPVRPPVIVIQDDNEDLDLGLGLSLVRLNITDDEEIVVRGERIEYEVEWENISELDLEDLDVKIDIPNEIEIIDISRGRFDRDTNTIFFTIDELDGADYEENIPGDSGRMTISGTVGRSVVGNLLTSEAEISYDNPVNRAKENARDFDISEYGTQIAGVTASIFGLANITFLGWLVILLGLFIIFLVARWLYLEREELRAQAYLSGGYGNQRYGQAPQMPPYQNQGPRYDVAPPAQMPPAAAPRDDYEPYRPNRG